MTSNEQLISALIAARDSLTRNNWRKGAYFKREPRNSNICMCAHGALQAQVNPKCQEYLWEGKLSEATLEARGSGSAAEKDSIPFKLKIPQQIWDQRPDWVKDNKQDAHYLLGMVGLTIEFNDAPGTTLKMVKAKFDEAIELARVLD